MGIMWVLQVFWLGWEGIPRRGRGGAAGLATTNTARSLPLCMAPQPYTDGLTSEPFPLTTLCPYCGKGGHLQSLPWLFGCRRMFQQPNINPPLNVACSLGHYQAMPATHIPQKAPRILYQRDSHVIFYHQKSKYSMPGCLQN